MLSGPIALRGWCFLVVFHGYICHGRVGLGLKSGMCSVLSLVKTKVNCLFSVSALLAGSLYTFNYLGAGVFDNGIVVHCLRRG